MLYNPTLRALVLERTDCRSCKYSPGTEATPIPCGTCNGTGKGPRGGIRGCKTCHGFGRSYDQENRRPCSTCGGDFALFSQETFCDSAPTEALDALGVVAVRVDRANTWAESYLGVSGDGTDYQTNRNTLWSTTDYGRRVDWSDADIAAEVREKIATERTQAVKIVKPYARHDAVATLHDRIEVRVTTNGYSVVAISD